MADSHDGSEPRQTEPAPDLMTTLELLDRYKGGDATAMNLLLERSLPPLRRWARGRLPQWARSTAETNDLIQNAIIRALPHLKSFEVRHPGALQAYLRQAISNHIRDEIRRVKTRPAATELDEAMPDDVPSPLERAIGQQGFERYEAALQRLRPADREAIVARIELQQSYEEVAIALGKPSAAAARMAVTRAVRNLIAAMAGLA
jgi:RNA polymerase sigma-70 factor (ECF subfamily)